MSNKMKDESVKKKIESYLKDGWSITTEGKNYITLKKPKKFNGWLFGLLILLGLIPGVIYLIYYASKSEKTITIQR